MKALATVFTILAAAGLAFGAHQFYVKNPKIVSSLLQQETTEEPEQAAPPPVDPLVAMQEAERRLRDLYAQHAGSSAACQNAEAEIQSALDEIASHGKSIREQDDVSEKRSQETTWTELGARFLAARMVPATFGEGFVAYSDTMIQQSPDRGQAGQVAALQFLQQHSFDQPVSESLMTEVNGFLKKYPEPATGVALYSQVAAELHRHQQSQSAEMMLEQGLKRFAGHPQVSIFVHQLADQGHRPPAKSAMSMATWEKMHRQAEVAAKACGPRKSG